MNRSRLLLPAFIAGLLLAGTAFAARLTSDAGEVRDIRYASGNGNTAVLYAATQGGGVFKSTNAGLTWAATGLNTGYAWKLAVSPLNSSRVYVATDSGLYRTDDAGANWTQRTFTPARAVAINPGSSGSDTLLLGVPGQGILRSTDNGESWSRQSSGLDSMEVTQIVYQSAGVAFAALDCNYQDLVAPLGEGNWGGLFRATNATSGTTISWGNFNNGGGGGTTLGGPPNCIKAIAANSTTVFAGTYDPFGASGRIYRSTGFGWTGPAVASGTSGDLFGVESISIDRNSSTTIHGGARAIGVWGSTDNGVNYAQKVDPTPGAGAGNNPDVWTKIYAIESVPGLANTVLVAAKGAGVMRTTNYNSVPANTIAWDVAPGITADRVRALANHASAAPNTYWMGLEGGGVMKSTNSGTNWTMFNEGFQFGGTPGVPDPYLLSATALAADPSNAATVIVGTRGGGLLQLNAGGTAWTTDGLPSIVTLGSVDHKPQDALIPSSGLVYYTLFDGPAGGKGGGLLRSSSGPGSLAQTVYPGDITQCPPANGQPAGALGSGHKVVQAAGTVAYLLRYDGMLYKSSDNFTSNTAVCPTAAHVGFERLYFHDLMQNPTDGSVLVGATNKGIYRSTDGGNNFSRVTISGLGSQVLSSVGYVGATLFGVERGGGFYCSNDNGSTWQAKSLGGLPGVSLREIRILKGAVHILTDGGGVYNGFSATCP